MPRLFLFLLLAALVAAAEFPEASISNGIVTARLHMPDAERGFYRGTRFDWSGQISSLRTKDHEYFGQWFEKYDPKLHDAILGPVEEFVTGDSSLGYEDAGADGDFIRIGVGTVRKPAGEERYKRFGTYQIVNGGKWTTRAGGESAEFIHELAGPNGYAYRYVKKLHLPRGRSELVIEHTLRNTGSKPINTSQYNHNFFVMDGQPTGPDTFVKFPFVLKPKQPLDRGLAEVREKEIVYLKELQSRQSVFAEFEGYSTSASDYDVHLGNRKTGAAVRIVGDQAISKLIYWSIRTTFCPEAYITFSVEPGREKRWTYRYRFE